MKSIRWLQSGLVASAVLAAISASQPAAAQSAACVNLLAGAGYAAKMGVKFGGSYTDSGTFAIGQHGCIKLPVEGMVNGAPYEVVVSAIAGSTHVQCTPSPSSWQSSNTSSVVYNAKGTTLNVSCTMPSTNN